MDLDDDDDEEPPPPVTRITRKAPVKKPPPARQTQLQFPSATQRSVGESQASNSLFHRNVVVIPSDDEDIDDDEEDEFVPMPSQRSRRRQ